MQRMQAKYIYEYAILRIVPVVEREEFVNAGVILFCKSEDYIGIYYHLPEKKILALMPEADVEEIRKNLEAFSKIAKGEKDGGPIALNDVPGRFRWLTAVRSASIQTSRPHPGVTDDLEKTIKILFEESTGVS
jgi:hypothetical protein